MITEKHYGKHFVRLDNGVYGVSVKDDGSVSLGDYVYVKIEAVNYNKKEVKLSFQGKIKSHKNVKKKIRKK